MPDAPSNPDPNDDRLIELSAEAFRQHLHTPFRITHAEAEGHIDAELIEVGEVNSHTQRTDRTPFSLVFLGPENAPLEQSIYHLTHDAMGEMDLFLVTVGPGAEDPRMRYEVVFT